MGCKDTCKKNNISGKSDEELFLESYNINNYDRPSVVVDIAAFTIRAEKQENYRVCDKGYLELLLIKRGKHPFINKWALPGGFLKADETIEECALREITEEAGITPTAIMPVGTFSKPDRDPRGRIISNAFTSIISENENNICGNDDAVDAKWFEVLFEEENDIYTLILKNDECEMKSVLKQKESRFGQSKFEIIDEGALAFDHASIVASALTSLRGAVENFDTIFDFLPEKFTLSRMQRVQEIVLNISILPANFRRKIAGLVEETDEYTEGYGHRPAKLFRRKMN